MSQYNSEKNSGASRSRARSSSAGSRSAQTSRSSSSRSSSTSRKSASSRSTGARSSYNRKSTSTSGRRGGYKRRNRRGPDFMKIAIGGVILIIAITVITALVKGIQKHGGEASESASSGMETVEETELQKEVTVDGINITGMSREEARSAILKDFPWAMKVTWEDQSCDVEDLMAEKVDALLNEIFEGEPKESYSLDTNGLEDAAKAAAARVAAQWDKKAKNGSISSYDAASDKFIFSGAQTGVAVDQEKLASDILAAVNDRDFDAVITASVNTVQPEYSEEAARQRYEKIGSFTTKTTANQKRNTNVKLAAQAINGTVVQPGQEFSFNDTVGQRTEAKGYQGAAAYNNGEVVEEIGGGVCQVSSTLYNAVVKAGLKTTVRRSHTYEPSYVTPGTDATVSWGGPDYKFVNNSSAGIGIRASYSDQTVTVSIYGIPVLEDGVSYSLKSTKMKDTDPPTPTYEEDPTLEPGVEKVKSKGSIGSQWETRLVVTKNGEVVSQEVDHKVTYKGHAPVILRNTSGTVAETQPGETQAGDIDPSQSSVAPEGAGDGLHQSENNSQSSAAGEKPVSTTAAETQTAPTTAAQSAPTPTTAAQPTPTTAAQPTPTTAAQSAPTTAAPNPAAPGNAAPGGETSIPTIAPNPGV